ncbi:LytR/AlgR family response regulator transcription factor [Flavobacterium gawalongense]|uniref:Response regulator transcription factor n=1 Tax=Flavobacterium gawalongense TaxID=2594432 RepID=A0A553BG68_9FLAO|nr:LytTR family DNA-binding domain-containing protein [Flavobacterium gawalongense]TRW99916.1 response regulator transcription factor [Flavobacterium gawalongense]TRX04380.1 response regulator transcription factor [Flavobacterium gawalongense]TRX07232.1 response regulator transcription factor [Flavobacterium gawalongense]TRX07983.1 response regulator transcription factor [Flavobacterium gawalongense]TRX24234.1 response regulator transcription factor [Flavobacterium gawalongense]
MDRYSCIIIEDEPLALERTKSFVNKIPFLNLCGTFDNALNGLSYLKSNKVDLLFLDINMDELSGIELLESSKIESQVIITTAYQEYAIKGYELNVTDYLLKPFTFDRFLKAINKAQENINQFLPNVPLDFIFVKTENRLEKINLKDILFIEGMRDYRRIHTINKKIMTLQNFSELEQIIPSNLVCRVHKSYMVGINKIESIERMRIKISDQRIPISETYKELFFQVINNRI